MTGDKQGMKSQKKTNARILLVEDDEDQSEIVRMYLLEKHPDLTVVVAENGTEALEILENNPFKIIVLDYQVPEYSGLEIMDQITKLKTEGRLQFIPDIIFMTGHGSEEVAVEAMKKGARDYIIKRLDFHRKIDDIVTNILAYEPDVPRIPLTIDDLCIVVFNIGPLGPAVLELDKQDCPELFRPTLSMLGVYYYTAIGQGKAHHQGLFGPLPVPGAIADTHSSLAYTLLVDDNDQTDSRMKGKSYCLITVLYPSEYRSLFYNQDKIKNVFDSEFGEIKDIKDIDYDFILELKRNLFAVLQ
ncbi:MAG: response regulator [Candidatus Odinarchaeota archaeon]